MDLPGTIWFNPMEPTALISVDIKRTRIKNMGINFKNLPHVFVYLYE